MAINENNTNNTVPNPTKPTKPFIIVNFQNCIHLTPTNYLAWKIQIEATMIGYDLFKYLDGSLKAPPTTITTDNVSTTNPAYLTWMRQDKLILGALVGTLTQNLVPLISTASTSHDAWSILANTYANPSRGHLKQIKSTLNNLIHTSQTISEYMQAIKACVDQLATVGKPMDHEDVIEKILNGLDYESYKPVIDAVNGRDTAISFEELHEKLITRELVLKSLPPSTTFNPTAHAMSFRHPSHRPNQPYSQPPTNNQNTYRTNRNTQHNNNNNPTTNRTPRPFLGRCQWCRAQGNVISKCPSFTSQYPNITFPAPTTNHTSTRQAHTMTTTTTKPTTSWLLDSGTSHHVTNDLNKLSLHTPYEGTEELVIGDGTTLPISHTGAFVGDNPTTSTI
ncbi:uncharacterized protein LOC110691642 [Chenopodium quinoa]|uniref:uncharacterized protein LOC110691642 n=1 Tax=Chenopodium quinoa TaxID=63459 RepID=UPI000B793A07|nr:uncharacterized protein LOC110691642 [Chenopodium quinoa]